MTSPDLSFLSGGGELGALIRTFDWSSTPLGSPETWPRGLKTAVRIMLTSRQAMWIGWGPSLTYLYNDAYKAIIGGRHPVALGQPVSTVWREIWSEIGPRLSHVLTTNSGTYDEALLLMMERNGYPEETYYTFSYSPIPDDEGGTAGVFCANTDDTERVVRERQLAMLRQLASAAADARTVPEACALSVAALQSNRRDLLFALLYTFDPGGGWLRRAAAAGLDASHPLAPGVVPAGTDSPWPIASALASGVAVPVDTTALPGLPTGDWHRPPSRAVVVPLSWRGQAGPAGVLVLGLNPFRLFDERYQEFVQLVAAQVSTNLANARAYEEERQRAEALAELDRAKSVFFSNVSHELRTPLTLMLAPLDDLRLSTDSPALREQLSLIHRNGLRLLRLVNTLLDFSRIEAGRVVAHYERVDVAELTRDLASTFRSAVERAGLRLIVDCPAGPLVARVDRQMWEKVLLNLLSNAFKYTLQGTITVRLRRDGDTLRLTVEDTGVGIPAAELPRVFERFHRIESVRGRTHEGTGIGLALVQELVRLHGGEVDVDSAPGVGSTFTVSMPSGVGAGDAPDVAPDAAAVPAAFSVAERFAEEAARWLPEDTRGGAGPAPAVAGGQVAADLILLADDNADMRDYAARLLGARWRVQTAANGRLALEAARRQRPQLVITDVMMPELDGFGLLQALRADPQLSDVPVLMLSARAGEEATLEGLHAGADDYLVKPFSARELVARAEAQILRSRLRAIEERHARRLAAVFAQAPIPIALLRGPDHVFESANAPYLELVPNRPIVGLPIREALPELAGQGLFELLDQVRATGRAHVGRSLGVQLDRGGGAPEETFFDFVYQPVLDDDGGVGGIVVIAYDVTQLARAQRDAELANRAKDEFLAMLGHELRNPLAPILTALQLLRLRGADSVAREREVIERQVQHLVTLVDDLLDVSRITRGKVQLRRSRHELADIVATAIETASPLLEQQRHYLHVEVPTRGLVLDADADRLSQVVANLLTNAAKYTEPEGRITLTAQVEGPDAVLRVQDTGIGISAEMLPRLFELFTQERQALDRSQGGLGLGLSIVRSLVLLHGGTVTAHSDGPGSGSEFVVRLPLAQEGTPAEARPGAPAGDGGGHRRLRRVLIVDDNTDAAAMLAESIRLWGHDVRTARDGPEALRVVAGFVPDVALLDIGLPVMDGHELARRLRDEQGLEETRLVALTGYGLERDRDRSAEAGFVEHLVKPVDLLQLQTLLEREARTPMPARRAADVADGSS